jgi:putative membrane protein
LDNGGLWLAFEWVNSQKEGSVNYLRNIAVSVLACGLLFLPALAQENGSDMGSASTSARSAGSGNLSASDALFMKKAAEGNKAEVELGQMAEQKASSDAVKSFGKRMMKDHGQASEQLESIAGKLGVTLPNKVNAKDQATKNRLEKLSGNEFDQAYMRDMVKDHTNDVPEFQKAASTASNPDLKNFAEQTLPTLQSHLKQARQIVSGSTMSAETR